MKPKEKIPLINTDHPTLSTTDQADLLGIGRSTVYYTPYVNPHDLILMNEIDRIYTECPFYGKRRIRAQLLRLGHSIGIQHTRTLMQKMGLQAIYPKPKTSCPNKAHTIYPYLLRGLNIYTPNQVWGTDITYIRLGSGFIYLVAILDWFSRYVVSLSLIHI